MWKVITSSNLNPPLKLFFYSPILTISQLGFFILYIISSFSFFFFFFFLHVCLYLFIFPFFSFFFSLIQEVLSFSFFFFFLPPYTFVLISLSPPSFLSFSPSFKKCFHSLFFYSSSRSLFFYFYFYFYLISEQPLCL